MLQLCFRGVLDATITVALDIRRIYSENAQFLMQIIETDADSFLILYAKAIHFRWAQARFVFELLLAPSAPSCLRWCFESELIARLTFYTS